MGIINSQFVFTSKLLPGKMPGKNNGQIIIEYVLMFTVIVVVIIFAATNLIQPSVNKLFEDTSGVINQIGDDFAANAYRW
jgi:uncharacterized protein (UPF0333 family)